MPFEFVCPFCHSRTKVADEYLGQSGPCVNCGKHVMMPTRNAQGILVASIQTGNAPKQKPKDSRPKNRPLVAMIATSIVMALIGILVGLGWFVLPLLRQRMELISQRRDLDNMKTIVEALNAYSDKYGTYPPPVVFDVSGKKLYSWRVLILPFLGYETLYKQFQLDQPWDSPANTSLITKTPSVYVSSNASGGTNASEPNYVLITGPGTIFPPSGPLSRTTVTDPLTILLVETTTGNTTWSEPGDIDISKNGLKVGNSPMKEMGGLHRSAFVAFTSDSAGLRIPKSTAQLVLDAMVTPTAGENVQATKFKD